MTDFISFYSTKVEAYNLQLKQLKKKLFYTASFRLFTFILLLCLVYFYFRDQDINLLFAALFILVLFLFLVKRSATLNGKKLLCEKLLFVNSNELAIIKGERNKFDNGQFAYSNESYYADLDVFGEASLYHVLNRTSTRVGSSELANLLKHTFTDATTISNNQLAIKALAPQHGLREQLIAKSLLYKNEESNVENIQAWLNEEAKIITNKWMLAARLILPFINLVTLIISLYVEHYLFLITSVLITWIHIGFYSKYIQRQHSLLGKKQELLDQYTVILKEFESVETIDASLLQQLKSKATEAHVQVNKLAMLSNLLDQRLNILVNIFLNSFLLYDVQVMIKLEQWKLKNKSHFASWVKCVASIESLTSISTFAFNNPAYTYPVMADELLVEATDLAHPLIEQNERIPNDVHLGKASKLLLVTGSNMSGKTTYLRTIGINVVLAQCGAPVCASSFIFQPVNIYTSIRISDSLQDHTSYFMAELKRLSQIKERISSNLPSLVLIDEILRGTNSEDKYFGSAEFVRKLIQYNCLTLFATHDLKLSELENEYNGVIKNYCFESVIKDDELIFDYKVLKGVAQNKNASFLMKKMKII